MMLKLPVCYCIFFFLNVFSAPAPAAQVHIEADEIKTAEPHKAINDSGKPCHVSEDKRHQVKAEDTDQQPV